MEGGRGEVVSYSTYDINHENVSELGPYGSFLQSGNAQQSSDPLKPSNANDIQAEQSQNGNIKSGGGDRTDHSDPQIESKKHHQTAEELQKDEDETKAKVDDGPLSPFFM
jgi:hypothetical protein